MWEIDNTTPFAADYSWVRDRNGADTWVVAVRGTFLIDPDGSTSVADEQSQVCAVPKYVGDPGQSSLIYESDLIHTKPKTDVTLLGHAYAPGGRSARQVDVTLSLASISKTLRVFGDRYRVQGGLGLTTTIPEPFETLPIVYERAFGGIDVESRISESTELGNEESRRLWIRCGRRTPAVAAPPEHRGSERLDYVVASAACARGIRTDRAALVAAFPVGGDLRRTMGEGAAAARARRS